MSLVGKLIGFGLRQVIGLVGGDETGRMAAIVAGPVIQLVEQHFIDHSQTLPTALAIANDRAWQTLSIALAGDGFLDKIKVFFASADDKGIREQVRLFLQDKTIGYEGTSVDFRKTCLAELNQARQQGLLTAKNLSPKDVARQAASFQRYGDPKGMVAGAEQVMEQIADDLASGYPNLARLLRQRLAGGPPLLVSAFAYFFRCEVETDDELAHGLFFDGLRQLSASQEQAFDEVHKALISLGDQFERVFEQLGRIETVVVDTHVLVEEVKQNVETLRIEIQKAAERNRVHAGDLSEKLHVTINNPQEQAVLRRLRDEYRKLPPERQSADDLLLLADSLSAAGLFGLAREGHEQAARLARQEHNSSQEAEAKYKEYRDACQQEQWDDALACIQKAAELDRQRFEPFPLRRYRPKRILGAGGFGTVFLCQDSYAKDEQVAIKAIHTSDLARSVGAVFEEARILQALKHSSIIGVRHWDYGEPYSCARPYIIMDYFPGKSLDSAGQLATEDFLLIAKQIARGMKAAHDEGVLHRDLKPDNILVRNNDGKWEIKIIDFGLAVRQQSVSTSLARPPGERTIEERSFAGTFKYASPEQKGELPGIEVGKYSDVYCFGKTCYQALFKTTEPVSRHLETLPRVVRKLFEKCVDHDLEFRYQSFEPILETLEAPGTWDQEGQRQAQEAQRKQREAEEQERHRQEQAEAQRTKQEQARQQAELERKRREQEETEKKQQHQEQARQQAEVERKRRENEETERQRKELERLQKEGESRLALFVREVLDRTQGRPTQDDSAASIELCKQHRIPSERAKQIVDDAKAQWQKAHSPKAQRTMNDKQTSYRNLVDERKKCTLCADLVNPSLCAGGKYDSTEIGPWSRWQGDLNASVMVVGRDWGDLRSFEHQEGRDSDGRTNSMLCKLLGEAGFHPALPSAGDVQPGGLFFTNAVLCLKQSGIQDKPPSQDFLNRNKFLRCQIDIIQPKLVVCLGQSPYRAVLSAYGRSACKGTHLNAVEGDAVRLPDGGPLVVALFDCSARSLNMNRNFAEQQQDWRRVGAILQSLQ